MSLTKNPYLHLVLSGFLELPGLLTLVLLIPVVMVQLRLGVPLGHDYLWN